MVRGSNCNAKYSDVRLRGVGLGSRRESSTTRELPAETGEHTHSTRQGSGGRSEGTEPTLTAYEQAEQDGARKTSGNEGDGGRGNVTQPGEAQGLGMVGRAPYKKNGDDGDLEGSTLVLVEERRKDSEKEPNPWAGHRLIQISESVMLRGPGQQ